MNDTSPELRLMAQVIACEYAAWGHPVPEILAHFRTVIPKCRNRIEADGGSTRASSPVMPGQHT